MKEESLDNFHETCPIEELEISRRSINCLHSVGITTINHLLEFSVCDLLKIKNFGRVSLHYLTLNLGEYNLYLKGE